MKFHDESLQEGRTDEWLAVALGLSAGYALIGKRNVRCGKVA